MLIGGAISYYFAAPSIALASISAFLVAETIDCLYTRLLKNQCQSGCYYPLVLVLLSIP